MGKYKKVIVKSCYQCAGITFCYGTKNPDLNREYGRSKASKCISLHKGLPNETVAVLGYNRGLSRANAEKLVSKNIARWVGYNKIEAFADLPQGIHNRLIKENQKKQLK